MKKIEIGMLVRILSPVNTPEEYSDIVGHVGKVLRPCNVYPGNWDIEGAETHKGKLMSFRSEHLEPVNPDHTPAGEEFTEAFKKMLKGKKIT